MENKRLNTYTFIVTYSLGAIESPQKFFWSQSIFKIFKDKIFEGEIASTESKLIFIASTDEELHSTSVPLKKLTDTLT